MHLQTILFLSLLVFFLGCTMQDTSQLAELAQGVHPFQGRWVITSSSGQPDRGHLFHDHVGEQIVIQEDIMTVPDDGGITKKLIPRPDISVHAFDIEPHEPKWKTWSRVAIIKVVDDNLLLCVNFPNELRPSAFKAGDDNREYVVLKRVKH